MSTAATVLEANRKLARQIHEEAKRDPQSPYAGKFIGLANGQVVVVADSNDEMSTKLRQIEPDPKKCYGVEANEDLDRVDDIWLDEDDCLLCDGFAR